MNEHMSEGPHDVAAYRITKQMVSRCVRDYGPEHEMTLAVKSVDNLLELASCPHCQEHVPDLVAVTAIMPEMATMVMLHLVAALEAANRGLVKAANNYFDLPQDVQDQLREAAGMQPIPDYVPEG